MENVTHALFLAFAMLVLVLGLSYGIYLLGSMNYVAKTLIQSTDATADYQMINHNSSDTTKPYTRIVGADTVISTIYRYYKEMFSVEIYDFNQELVQIFDLTIENKLASNEKSNPEWIAYNNLYGENKKANLFGVPWTATNEYKKQRIDMYISGKEAYINGTMVDYSGENNFKSLLEEGDIFEEQFIQYTYEGQTISEGDEIDTITGSLRAQNKIIIRYTQQKNN